MHFRRSLFAIVVLALALPAPRLPAQAVGADSAAIRSPAPRKHYRLKFVLGFATSILAHESGHVVAAFAVGGHPSFGFNKWRPTIYSGIDAQRDPHKQFVFSAAGLTVQTLMDETLLDVPHARGSIAGPFERGLLTGGIATVLFYITLGRTGSVSDVTFMAKTSSLTHSISIAIDSTVCSTRSSRASSSVPCSRGAESPAIFSLCVRYILMVTTIAGMPMTIGMAISSG